MSQISLTDALMELKHIDKKIKEKAKQLKDSIKVVRGKNNLEKSIQEAKTLEQSLRDLINRKNIIKSKLDEANNHVEVVITSLNGSESRLVSITRVINLKRSLEVNIQIMNDLKTVIYNAEQKVDSENKKLDNEINTIIESQTDNNSISKDELIDIITEDYYSKKGCYLASHTTYQGIVESIDIARQAITNINKALKEANDKNYIELE